MNKNKVEGPTARVFGMFWGWGRKYFVSYTFMTAFHTLIPFFNLWISAAIVSALYEGREQREVVMLVVTALAGNLSARFMTALMKYFVDKEHRNMENNEKLAFNDKVLSLDYDKLENPELRTLRRKIITNAYINWYGPKNMLQNIEALIQVAMNLIYSTILFAEMMVMMIHAGFEYQSVLYLILIFAGFAGNVILSAKANKKKADLWNEHGQKLMEGNRLGSAIPQSGQDLRIYHMLPFVRFMNDKYNREYEKVTLETNIGVYKLMIPSIVIGMLPELFSYLLVCFYCGKGVFPIGGVIKYVGYLQKFVQNLNQLFTSFTNFKVNRPYLETYLEFFDVSNDMYQGSLSVEKRSDKRYEVEFKNVSFQYPESNEYALKNISFKFEIGQRLAVVGRNGSGKTTLIKLLCRLYDPTDGEIEMNDFNIRKYDYKQYLDIFSVVFQDYKLLSFSLGQNVAANGIFDADRAEKYLKEVGFDERYQKLPNKLSTVLYKDFDEEGVQISGGEAQKIALARALYKDAPFIILDEPTAALDPLAEAEIYSKFNEIVGDKTTIYISHRLSSCRFCDKILVLDHGEIVQYGTHEELIADQSGKYYELWEAQAQYYVAN